MSTLKLFELEGREGYAVIVPMKHGSGDSEAFGQAMWLFERMVDIAELRAYHKSPLEGSSEDEQIALLNKYYYYDEATSLHMALFFVHKSRDMYARLEKFATVVESYFKKNNLI